LFHNIYISFDPIGPFEVDGIGSLPPASMLLTLLADNIAPTMERSCGSFSIISSGLFVAVALSRDQTDAVS
jgi:hypothetical protein